MSLPGQTLSDELSQLAERTARNSAGLRSLAAHLRKLAPTIVALRNEDVPWSWIAERIAQARGVEHSAEVTARIKTSWHQLRQGDRARPHRVIEGQSTPSTPPHQPPVAGASAGNGARASPSMATAAGISRLQRMQAVQRLPSINDQIHGDTNESS